MLATTSHWERWVAFAPVLVIGTGLIAAALILVVRAFMDSYQGIEHKRRVLIGAGLIVLLVLVLTFLGVHLPKEE